MDDPLQTLLAAAVGKFDGGHPFRLAFEAEGNRLELTVDPRPTCETAGPQPAADRPVEPVEGCGADILTVLRESGLRMTGPEIMSEFQERGIEWSESSLARWLKLLQDGGLVDNDRRAHPPGYGAVLGPRPDTPPVAPLQPPEPVKGCGADILLVAAVELTRSGHPLRLVLEAEGNRLELTVGPRSKATPTVAGRPPEPRKGCGADILLVLRESGCRLTRALIIEEFTERHIEHSERSVDRWLGILREEGHIDNDQHAHPPGYGVVLDPRPNTPPPGEPTEGCGADILIVLRTCNCRLTQPQIIDEMAERRLGPHSERNVTRWIRILRDAGLVDHDSSAHPPGYGTVR